MNRVGGTISLKADGEMLSAKGNFSYHLGTPKREVVVGADAVHGFKETPQAPYIKGAITDHKDLDLADFLTKKDMTIILDLANGKSIVLRDALNCSDGEASSEEGEIEVEFFGSSAQEIK